MGFRTAVSSLALLCALGSAFRPALADEVPDEDPETIFVIGKLREKEIFSATKTPTPLVDVPQSVTVISEEQIQAQAFFDLGDVTRFTPGVSVGQGEGHRDQITIRGQNTTADFYVDGVRDDVQYFRPLYNLDRVEVLKGANALIFGRGGGGGVINRVQKKPGFGEVFANATASVDSFGAAFVSGDANYALGETAAFRLNAYYESLDNHRDEFEGERFAVNPTAAFQVTDKTTVFASYEYVYDDRTVDRGVPSLDGVPLRGFDRTFFGEPDLNVTDFIGHVARARVDHAFTDRIRGDLTVQYADYDKLYQNLFPVGFDDDPDEAAFPGAAATVSLDGYRDETFRRNWIVQSNVVAEFDTGPVRHTLLFGGEFVDQDTENTRRDTIFTASNDDQITFPFTDPLAIPAFDFSPDFFNRDRVSDVRTYSVYIQDQIEIFDALQIILGGRYDRFEVDVDVNDLNQTGGAVNVGVFTRNDDEFSPRVGLVYKPVEEASLYASYSRSFLPRSGDQFLTLTPSEAALGPENFENVELGAKWDIRPNVSLTAAVFRSERRSGTTQDPDDAGNTILFSGRTRGVELQAAGNVTERLSVNAGYSFLDADEEGRVVDGVAANRTLAQVPRHMVSFFGRYEVTSRLGVGVGVIHQSSQFATIDNAVALPSFTRLDAALYYRVTDRIEAQVNIENLTDTDYFPAAHDNDNITVGEPINARFTLRAGF